MSAFQLRVIGSALIILLLDGMDAQMLGLLAPVILSDWMISKSALGPALAAALVGMALGSLYGGMIGDRIGRRGVLIGSTLVFGVSTALTSLSEGVWDMVMVDDIEVYQRCQEGMESDGGDWISQHRMAGHDVPFDGGLLGAGISEVPMRNQFRAWSAYMGETGA